MKKFKITLHKLLHWEYWPDDIVYSVPIIYYCFLALRARSFYFFNAANPGIKNGGMAMEPKHEIYAIQPPELTPTTLCFKSGTSLNTILQAISDSGLDFPLIAKPNIGMRGLAVAKVNNAEDLAAYILKAKFDFLVQELIEYPNEIGIFYCRYPDEPRGKISGIVMKEFLTVTGDGTSSIADLVSREPRYMLQLDNLTAQYGVRLQSVPANGEILNLVPFGNHVRGAKFTDAHHLITDKLTASMDRYFSQIPGFYYGRLDIRYNSFEELERGEKFSIIELNGSGSAPTHMYDPAHSIFFAWREIIRHFKILNDISIINHHKGRPYLTMAEGREMMRQNKAHIARLEAFK